jgi:hypothetical protein
MNYGIVLNVCAIAYADIKHVAAQDGVAPHRRLFSDVHVADHLSAQIDIGAGWNLRRDAAEWSDHIFRQIVTQ